MSEAMIRRVVVNAPPLDRAGALALRRALPAALATLRPEPGAGRIDTLVVTLPPGRPVTAEAVTAALGRALATARRRP